MAGGIACTLAWALLISAEAGAAHPDAARCTIKGSRGPDRLTGTPRKDVICARGGDDVVQAAAGNDVIRGGPGDDELHGAQGRDALVGNSGDDALDGGEGINRCDDGGSTSGANLCIGYYAIKDFDVSPKTVNTDAALTQATVKVRVVNTNPSPEPTTGVSFVTDPKPDIAPLSGGAITAEPGSTRDETWKGPLLVWQNNPPGRYLIGLQVGRGFDDPTRASLTGRQLQAAGFKNAVELTGSGSNHSPRITAFEAPAEIDTSQADQTAPFRLHIVDDDGVQPRIHMGIMSPSGSLVEGVGFQLESGDPRDGIWAGDFRLPKDSPKGAYRFWQLSLRDGFSEIAVRPADLTARGVDVPDVVQIGPGDNTPPTLRSFTADPTRVDVTDGSTASIQVGATSFDENPAAGFGWEVTAWRPIDPYPAASAGFHIFETQGLMQFPSSEHKIGREPGDYPLRLTLRDNFGNSRTYDSDQLAELGYPAVIHNGP
ncbi:MAG: hypothetical protein QOI10_2220 [Solirubrobacterales bacterium]|jgi:hypothetical protein|nr:hypothetical protein [Solirubrobacterales bacterium]